MSEKTFTWDYREQPPMAEIAAAVAQLSGGTVRMAMPETGSDECALTVTRGALVPRLVITFDEKVTEERAAELRQILADAIEPAQFRDRLAAVEAARDEYRDNAILHIRERDEAREQLDRCAGLLGTSEHTVSDLRALVAEILSEFHYLHQNVPGYRAEIGQVKMSHYRQRAGIGDGQITPTLTACAEPHPLDHRCFDCATDEELAAAIPPYPATGPDGQS